MSHCKLKSILSVFLLIHFLKYSMICLITPFPHFPNYWLKAPTWFLTDKNSCLQWKDFLAMNPCGEYN